jgi:hypothetical protein
MKGNDVRALQFALQTNVFGQIYLQGHPDGEYGPETMRAVKRAKYWLGYAERAIDGRAGPLLVPVLTGKRKLRKDQLARRKARLRARLKTPLRVKALNAMMRAPDEKENPPKSNKCSTTRWYGFIGAWCAMDITRFYVKAGSKAFVRGKFEAYVPWILGAARRGERGFAITANPQPGDIVVYDWNGDGVFDHTGLFVKWNDRLKGTFTAREGNTAVGNDSNGGQRMTRGDRRYVPRRTIFIHVSR